MSNFFKSVSLKIISSSRIQRLGWEFFWIGLGQALSVVGGLVGVRLLTQVLNPTLYGELALGLTIGGLVNQLVFGPLQQGILRFFGPAQEARELRDCIIGILKLLIWATIIVATLAGLAIVGLWATAHYAWISLALITFLLAMLSGYERALDAMQSALRQRAVTAWHQALSQWLRFLLALTMMAWLGAYSSVALLGYVLATLVVLASQFMFFQRKFRSVFSSAQHNPPAQAAKWSQQIQTYAWPFTTWGIFLWVQQSSDRWALQTFSQTKDVGYYTVLSQLGYAPILILTGIIVQFLQPILFAKVGDGTDPARVRHARQINFFVIVAFVGMTVLASGIAFILHAQVFAILVAPEYRSISLLMPWMVLSGGLFASSEVTALLLMSGMSTQILIAPKIGTAVAGIAMNIAGAYWLGLQGVVLASIGFSLLLLLWMLFLSHRLRQAEMLPASIANLRRS